MRFGLRAWRYSPRDVTHDEHLRNVDDVLRGRPDILLEIVTDLNAAAVRLGGIVTLPREERERTITGADFHAAATTSRHVLIAAARSTRCD